MGACGTKSIPPNPNAIDLTHFELLKVTNIQNKIQNKTNKQTYKQNKNMHQQTSKINQTSIKHELLLTVDIADGCCVNRWLVKVVLVK
jgi:hypothetical protein